MIYEELKNALEDQFTDTAVAGGDAKDVLAITLIAVCSFLVEQVGLTEARKTFISYSNQVLPQMVLMEAADATIN